MSRRDGEHLPDAVLFACNLNQVRSPMAAGLMNYLFGNRVFVESVGVCKGVIDPLAVEVMNEIGIDISHHAGKSFDDLEDTNFALVISLTAEAHAKALELARTMAVEADFWPTTDPTLVEGNREQRLSAYRALRDELLKRLARRFSPEPGGSSEGP